MAFNKYGSKKLTWAQLVEPARRLATDGYPLSYRLASLLYAFEKNLAPYEESKRIFLRGGKFYDEGEVFKQPELAATLARIQKFGAKDFYEGETAKMIADDMKAHNGLITLDNLFTFRLQLPGGMEWQADGSGYFRLEPSATVKNQLDLVRFDTASGARSIVAAAWTIASSISGSSGRPRFAASNIRVAG